MTRRIRLLAALLACAALPTPAAARAQRGRAPAADSARALTLEQAVELAGGVSEDLALARAAVTRAEGQQEKAHSQFLPQIYGSASYTRTLKSQFEGFGAGDTTGRAARCGSFVPDTAAPIAARVRLLEQALGCSTGGSVFGDFSSVGFGAANQYSLGLSLTQNLFAGGRIVALNRQAGAARRGAGIALTSAQAQVILTVTQAYYDAALSDRLVAIAQATLAQAETTYAQTRLARQVGNLPEFDLLRAQVTRDNQVPVVIQRRADRDVAYLRLRQLLRLPFDTPLALTTALDDTARPALPRFAAAAAPDTSVDERAPVRQARENVAAGRDGLTVARAQRIPTLTLSSAYGRVAFPTGGLPDWGQFRTNWTITGAIQVPLYTGGAIHGDEMIARAGLRDAEARLRQTRDLAALDTRDAFARLDAARAQYAASAGTVEQAAKAYQIAEVRYHEGISTQTELSDSRILLQQAEANRAQAARDLQVARIRVALLHDLPLGGSGPAAPAAAAAGSGAGAPTVPATPVPAPARQAGTVANASQTGVNP